MNTYLISYDLVWPENSSDYTRIINHIKSLWNWANPLKSLFLIVTDTPLSTIRDGIWKVTDDNDKILVIDITWDSWGTKHISQEVNNWLNTNVKNYN